MATWVLVNESYINPDTIAAVIPEAAASVAGVQVAPAAPDRCQLLTIGGQAITCTGSALAVATLLGRVPPPAVGKG